MCSIKEEHFSSSFNLTPGEFRMLKLFAFKDSYSIKELCELLGLTPGRITHLVDSLAKKRLMVRKINPEDRRNVTVMPSPRSKVFINQVFQYHIEFHKNLLKSVSDGKKKIMVESLEILVNAFKKWIKNK
jgi:DNA-binding MarR family transcriptional regulator